MLVFDNSELFGICENVAIFVCSRLKLSQIILNLGNLSSRVEGPHWVTNYCVVTKSSCECTKIVIIELFPDIKSYRLGVVFSFLHLINAFGF